MVERSEIKKFTYGAVQYKKGSLLTEKDLMSYDNATRVFVNDQVGNIAPKKKTGVLKFGYLAQGRWVMKDGVRMRETAKRIEVLPEDTEIYLAVERLPHEIVKPRTPVEIAEMLSKSIPMASLLMDNYTPIVWFNDGQNHVIYLGIDGKYNVYGLEHTKLESFYNIEDCIKYCHSLMLG